MIVISDKTVALWSIAIDDTHDFMGALTEERPDFFKYTCRIRTKKSEAVWDLIDEKQWFEYELTGGRDIALAYCRLRMEVLEALSGNKGDEILYHNNKQFFEELATKPWAHVKKFTKGKG